MFRKSFTSFLFIAAIVAVGHISSYAQDPIRGVVELQNADGTVQPVGGTLIEVYRTETKGAPRTDKTNKNGEFAFVGLMFGTDYTIVVSAPNCEPSIYPGIRPGMDNIKITLSPGDGTRWTEDEVRQAVTKDAKSGAGAAEKTAAEKKAIEEQQKAIDADNAERKKAEETNKNINALLKEGAAALEAKNYDVAIAKFDEAYRADPEFVGSAPVLLTNKGESLRLRGTAAYNSRSSGTEAEKSAALQKARADYTEAMKAFEKALEILDKAPADPKYALPKLRALKGYVVLQGAFAMAMTDPAKTAEAKVVLDRYLAAETDEAVKIPVMLGWGKAMQSSGEYKNAIHVYRIVLEKAPDNLDAMVGLGSALWLDGIEPPNETQIQEGLNLLQKFVDAAPDTHPMKADAKTNIDYVKESTKLTPKKTPTKRRN